LTGDEAEEEARFRAAIIRSAEAVFAVAQYLHARGGLWVRISPLMIRDHFRNRKDFSDKCDLDVCKAGSDRWKRVEVKRREFSFETCDEFPYETVFIGKRPDAYAYFILNDSMSHAALIRCTTRGSWLGPNEHFDAQRGYPIIAYECPKDVAEFIALH
jgi:hypothetical protein